MNKVYLNFKEFELGFLCQQDNKYIWVPNAKKIKQCFSKYSGGIDLFFLSFVDETVYSEIPYHFSEFLERAERNDLKKAANIKKEDCDFVKLYKMATLKYLNQDFYISI